MKCIHCASKHPDKLREPLQIYILTYAAKEETNKCSMPNTLVKIRCLGHRTA